MSNSAQLSQRKYIIGGFFILIAFIYVLRLFYIQVINDKYKLDAQNNAFRYLTEYPMRGYIYDRNGKLLVYNEPSYDLMVIPRETKGCDTLSLCEVLRINKAEYLKRLKRACQAPNSPRKQSMFEKQLSAATYAELQEKMYRFKGFFVQKRAVRKYPRPVAAHLLGYVGEVSKNKAETDPYYKEGDYIGVSGIERSYEEELRGKKGIQIAITDVHNKIIGKYADGKYDTMAIQGKPLYCTIDRDLQEYGERLMQGKRGALVALEPSTGEIICLISAPGYDPNLLVGGKERARNFARLYADTNSPLFNRAIQAMYPPGSTFKLIDALIAQNDGVIKRSTVFPCARGYPPMGGKPKCHPHAPVDLIGSVAQSCNSYYSYVFREIVDQAKYPRFIDGYNHWRNTVMTFGPGTHLGTDLPYDKPGNVPSVEYYNKVFGTNGWRSNTIVSLGIGQAELLLVPLQMANVVATIANKGFYYVPHCIRGVGLEKKQDKKFHVKHYVGVQNEEAYTNVIDGMQQCFDAGTAYYSRVPGVVACGKTGTAENPHGKSHAVFMAFAPREKPQIVIACLIENAGWGGTWSAPIVSLMIEKYITGKVTRPELEKRMMDVDLIRNKNLISTEYH
ncbi:MAG TPA: penicillin-binding transpeptidase domain-containing protein [Bacteroidia bacterium]|nr:penicillin-binding transpeptidase domain-containing protein [Bacteroidia bacterium]